jgi:dihydrofolate synthase / folylpolyglutamate synthase
MVSPSKPHPILDSDPAFRSYEEAEAFLCRFTDYEQMVRGTRYPDDLFDLSRIRALLSRMGNPHEGLHGIHLAGTKGKGSTAVFIEAILRAHGRTTGLFTSPHFIHKEERIRVSGRAMTRDDFLSWMNRLRADLLALQAAPQPPTFFDILTTVGFLHFRSRGVEASVMEVGLGGRLDSTNVFLPEVSVITRLGIDHTEKLGEKLGQIAAEKAGIVKPGVPVVSHPQEEEARGVILETCRRNKAPLLWVGQEIELTETGPGSRTDFSVRTPRAFYPGLELRVLGRHQRVNAAAAVAAAEIFLNERNGILPDPERVRRVLRKTRQPGRIDVVSEHPLLVVDVAHNALSVDVLVRTLRSELRFRDLHVLFACAADKDISSMVRVLAEVADRWTLTTFDYPRLEDPARIRDRILALRRDREVRLTPNPQEALEDARRRSGPEDCILCCGSFYLAAEIFKQIPSCTMMEPEPDPEDG